MSAGALRLDVVTIFPDYLAAARPLADRQGPRAGPDRPARARPARLHPRPAPHRRRHPVRRRRRHGHAPRALGRGARPRAGRRRATPGGDGATRRAYRTSSSPGPAACRSRQAHGARAGRASRGWRSPAGATRASTSGCYDEARERMPVSVVSLGDYVLNGGEVAVLAMVEAVARLLPGVIGNAELAGRGVARGRAAGVPRLHQAAALARAAASPRCCSPATTGGSPGGGGTSGCGVRRLRRPDMVGRLDPATLDARDRAVLGAGAARISAGDPCCGRLTRRVPRQSCPCHRGELQRQMAGRTSHRH